MITVSRSARALGTGCALALLCGCSSTGDGEVRHFDVRNHFTIDVPAGAREVQGWFALPDDREPLQEVEDLQVKVDAPNGVDVHTAEVRDASGNRFLHLRAQPAGGAHLELETRFGLARREALEAVSPDDTRPINADERQQHAADLAPNQHVAITPEIRADAAAVVGDEQNPVVQARLLYDWVLERVQYWVKFPDRMKASPVGSSTYCYQEGTGNCTDFHSLYAAAARSVGLPTRMVYGSFLKGPLDGQDTDQSYHCWIEFWAPEAGWIPLDVAVADVFVDDFELNEGNRSKVDLTVAAGYGGPDPALIEYYFGNLDARRVTWNRGRDLRLEPAPAGGPINALPKAYLEVDGKPLEEKTGWTRKLTFAERR